VKQVQKSFDAISIPWSVRISMICPRRNVTPAYAADRVSTRERSKFLWLAIRGQLASRTTRKGRPG